MLSLSRIAKTRQLATPYTNMLLQSLINTITGTGNAIVLLLFICSIVTGSLVYECERNAGSGFDSMYFILFFCFSIFVHFYPKTRFFEIMQIPTDSFHKHYWSNPKNVKGIKSNFFNKTDKLPLCKKKSGKQTGEMKLKTFIPQST